MNFKVHIRDLQDAVAKLKQAAAHLEGGYSLFYRPEGVNSRRILLSLRDDELTLRVSDDSAEAFTTLQVEPLNSTATTALMVDTYELQDELKAFAPDEIITLSTGEPDLRRKSDHEQQIPLHAPARPRLFIKGRERRTDIERYEPVNAQWPDEVIQHRLSISERNLHSLLQHTLFCTDPKDYRDLFRCLHLKIDHEQPQILRCTATDGFKLADLQTALEAPERSAEDWQAAVYPKAGELLLELLDANSDQSVSLQLSTNVFGAVLPGGRIRCKAGSGTCPDLSSMYPAQRVELRANPKTLKSYAGKALRRDSTRPRQLRLLFTAAGDLTPDGSDIAATALKRPELANFEEPDWIKATLRPIVMPPQSEQAPAEAVKSDGALFFEFINSSKQNCRLKAECSYYDGTTHRLVLSPYTVQEILGALSDCEQVSLYYDPQVRSSVLITPYDPGHTRPMTISYVISTARNAY